MPTEPPPCPFDCRCDDCHAAFDRVWCEALALVNERAARLFGGGRQGAARALWRLEGEISLVWWQATDYERRVPHGK